MYVYGCLQPPRVLRDARLDGNNDTTATHITIQLTIINYA